MKIIAISGSPRKGNTEWMLNYLLEIISRNGFETELILLRKLNIGGCNGCLACETGGKSRKGLCVIKDDMQGLYNKLLKADGIIFGTPVYFEMLSGLLKNFMDRTCPIWTKLEGKPVAGVAVAEEGIGKAIDNLKTYASVCNMRWVSYAAALAKKPGEVSKREKIGHRLERMARKYMLSIK